MDYEWNYMSPRPRHTGAGAVAALLSLLVHGVLLFGIVRLELPWLTEAIRTPRQRPVTLGDVRPDGRVPDPAAWFESPQAVEMMTVMQDMGVTVSEGLIEPPEPGSDIGQTVNLAGPTPPDEVSLWQPRQELLAIKSRVAAAVLPELPRLPIPDIGRIVDAPDLVLPIERDRVGAVRVPTSGVAHEVLASRPAAAAIDVPAPTAAPDRPEPAVVSTESVVRDSQSAFREVAEAITPLEPIEAVLQAHVATYTPPGSRYGYFRMEISRLGPEVLPVIAKDVVFMLDASASMAEQRLRFCREGLTKGLDYLGPKDTFEVVSFRQSAERCFGQWTARTPENLERARAFIADIRSGGNTDIFASVRELLAFERTPGRPVVVILITDGMATVGTTGSSEIIGEFTRMNDGFVSVYTIGTAPTADRYLLDLLSYSNRGDSALVSRGRWEIPAVITNLVASVSRPVLADVNFRFPAGARYEVYPVQTSNLYLDRPLVLHGRYPVDQKRVTFQAIGRAGERPSDMVFDIDLEKDPGVGAGDDSVATAWARQKVYHLMASYARQPDPDMLKAIRQTARTYRIDVPHRGSF